MPHKFRRRTLSATIKAACLLTLFVSYPLVLRAETSASSVLCRPDFATARRNELASKLRAITGWYDLRFNEKGELRASQQAYSGGSETARNLLAAAMAGEKLIVLEEASNRTDVVFCNVVEGQWTKDAANKQPVYIVLIDFTDFSHVMGDSPALAAFNVGWGVLHEIDHVVHASTDLAQDGEAGECEDIINKMRRECGLAERAEYFFTYLPGSNTSDHMTRFVRIAFDERTPKKNKKKRYWLVWDAALVGGLEERKQVVARK